MTLCHPLCQCDRCKPLQRVSYDTVSPAMSVWPMQTTYELWHCVTRYVSVTTANNGWVMTLCHPLCQCDRCKPLQRVSYDTVSRIMSVWPMQTTGELWHCVTRYVSVTDANNGWVMTLCHPLCQCDRCKQRMSYDTVSPVMSVWPMQTAGELWHCVTRYVSVTTANNGWVMTLCHPLCQCDRCKQRMSYDTVSPVMSVWPMQTAGELWHCVTRYVSVTTANNGWVMTLCHPLCQCDRCKQRMSYDTVSPAMSVWPMQTTGELWHCVTRYVSVTTESPCNGWVMLALCQCDRCKQWVSYDTVSPIMSVWPMQAPATGELRHCVCNACIENTNDGLPSFVEQSK